MKEISDDDKYVIKEFLAKCEIEKFFFSINQNPQSKNIKKDDAKQFREELSKRIKKYTGEVCVTFTFCSTKRNAPLVHKLVKNYMDLMHKTMSNVDSLSQIAFNDDDQVSYLHARHFYCDDFPTNEFFSEDEKKAIQPYISIKIFSIVLLNEMMSLVKKYCDRPMMDDFDFQESSLGKTLQTCKGKPGFEFVDDDMIASARKADKMMTQWDILDFLNISVFDIIPIWNAQNNPMWSFLQDSNFFKLKIMSINIPQIPTKEGDSAIFKTALEREIEKFKDTVKTMKEILIPVAMKFVYFPPLNHSKDMDNVVLETIPKIITILRPPRMMQIEPNFDERLVGINEYEIIRMQSNNHCPSGALYFLVRDAFKFKSFWDEGLDLLKQCL